ncbi:MAG TPA: AAA family ATPase, partial [Anaerolineaceae bacterium]|nr:AAA family ATPase [Anaerolineaceae bacterium]
MAKILSLVNQKGGVGKTTTNINLAAFIALKGYRVLVIDIDPQGNTSSGLGIEKEELDNTTYELLLSDVPISDVIHDVADIENLKIVPSNMDLAG